MIADISNAQFDSATGTVRVTLPNCDVFGYPNQVIQMQDAQTISIPDTNLMANLDKQSDTQVMATGYQTSITDKNYQENIGGHTRYSQNWYDSVRISGVEIQQANTANIENQMMGQSTNGVLNDIMSLIIEIIDYLATHTHTYSPGSGSPTPTGQPIQPVPDDSQVVQDNEYIQNNNNLAITGTYQPKG